MRVIDLTQTISADMPVYPGTECPTLEPANSYEKDGFKETKLHFYSHTGTHIDPPYHLFSNRTALDEFDASQFVGTALVIDCRDIPDGGKIIMQKAVCVEDGDTPETLQRRIMEEAEWKILPLSCEKVCAEILGARG